MLRSFWDVKWRLQLNGVTTRGAEWNILVNIRRLTLALPYVAVVLLTPATAYTQVDCSVLDPRISIAKEREGKISGSVDTLYKIAKAGGSIEGRMKDEIINLQQSTPSDERTVVKIRALYLFCGMIANSPDIPIEKKIALFESMLNTAGHTSASKVAHDTTTLPAHSQTTVLNRPKPPAIETVGRQQPTTLYEDGLNKGQKHPESQLPNIGRTQYRDGWYILENYTTDRSFFMRFTEAGYFPAFMSVRVDLRLDAGPQDRPYGLLLGAQDATFADAYGVLIRADGATEVVRWTGDVDTLEMYLPPNPAVRTGYGVTNSLRVEVQNSDLTYFVNEVQIGRCKVSSNIHGYIGFYTDVGGMNAGFGHLKVTQ